MRRRDLQRHIQLRHHPKNLHVIKNSNSQTHSSDSQMTLLSQSSSSENEDDEADQKRWHIHFVAAFINKALILT